MQETACALCKCKGVLRYKNRLLFRLQRLLSEYLDGLRHDLNTIVNDGFEMRDEGWELGGGCHGRKKHNFVMATFSTQGRERWHSWSDASWLEEQYLSFALV